MIERRNPLPAGRYWLDVPAAKLEELQGFFAANASRVHVESTEQDDGVTWMLFTVSEALPWFAVNFGYPTVAGANVHSKADVVQTPDLPPGPAETAQGLLDQAGNAVHLIGIGFAVLIGLKILEAVKRK